MQNAHRKQFKRRPPDSSNHTKKRHIVLNLDCDVGKKITRMKIKIEGKESNILLDSCASISIISTDFVKNYLGKSEAEIYGPSICVRGIGNNANYASGYIDLTLEIFGERFIEKFIVMYNSGIPGDILLSMGGMGR